MPDQRSGLVTNIVDGMVRRSLRARMRGIYWNPPAAPLSAPVLFVCNHHGWFDGYVLHVATEKLGLPMLLWVEEFDAFPLFAKLGAMPFPADDVTRRAATVRRTIKNMREQRFSLVLLPEGVLHDPPELLPFGSSLEFVAKKVPEAMIVPVAIRYEFAMHERPECFLAFGEPIDRLGEPGFDCRAILGKLLEDTTRRIRVDRGGFELLFKGRKDVNERLDMRAIPGRGRKEL